jgi:PKD repeat protein
MACSVTITSVSGSPGPPLTVTVDGTATDCDTVRVYVRCPFRLLEPQDVSVVAGAWSATFPNADNAGCACGESVQVHAECVDPPPPVPCSDDRTLDLPCPEAECPDASVEVLVGDCNADGTRTVTFTATITPGAGPVVAQWEFEPGIFGAAFVVAAPGAYTATHDYSPPGPGSASLTFVLPEGCPPIPVPFTPLEPCACPEVVDLTATVEGCAGLGSEATVTFAGTLSPAASGCTFHWDFGDGSPDVATTTPTTTHSYADPGTHPAAVTVVCDACIRTTTIEVDVPPCCPELESVAVADIDGCAGEDNLALVSFVATTNPPSAAGTYTWTFGDGATDTTGGPAASHPYGTSGTYTVEVSLTAAGCPPSSATTTVEVPACPPPPGDGDGDGGGSSLCGGFHYLIAILLGLTIAFGLVLLVFEFCLSIPVPGWLWGVLAGFAAAVAVAIAAWYLLCALDVCPCPTACDWLAIAWMSTLIGALVAAYLAGCCGGWWWGLVVGLFAVAGATFAAWIVECKPDRCTVLRHLMIAVVTGAATVIGYVVLIPAIAACGYGWVAAAIATLGGLLAAAYAACEVSEAD